MLNFLAVDDLLTSILALIEFYKGIAASPLAKFVKGRNKKCPKSANDDESIIPGPGLLLH